MNFFARHRGLLATSTLLLAGAIINPREHSPAKPTRRLLRRQQIIIKRMGIKDPPPLPS